MIAPQHRDRGRLVGIELGERLEQSIAVGPSTALRACGGRGPPLSPRAFFSTRTNSSRLHHPSSRRQSIPRRSSDPPATGVPVTGRAVPRQHRVAEQVAHHRGRGGEPPGTSRAAAISSRQPMARSATDRQVPQPRRQTGWVVVAGITAAPGPGRGYPRAACHRGCPRPDPSQLAESPVGQGVPQRRPGSGVGADGGDPRRSRCRSRRGSRVEHCVRRRWRASSRSESR